MVVGHDTTRNSISNGLFAFLDHPVELERLRRDPTGLVTTAADEIVRWTTPVKHFSRTATEDYVLRGQKIKAGDSVALFYASAKRDEEIYPDPYSFRIDRGPNLHLGFGVGEHFRFEAYLARLDLRVFWRQFAERFESIELTGPVKLLHASFVGGLEHIPVRYKIRPARSQHRSLSATRRGDGEVKSFFDQRQPAGQFRSMGWPTARFRVRSESVATMEPELSTSQTHSRQS
jgi:cytochrome P450